MSGELIDLNRERTRRLQAKANPEVFFVHVAGSEGLVFIGDCHGFVHHFDGSDQPCRCGQKRWGKFESA